jgi:uncharacterized membrane protein
MGKERLTAFTDGVVAIIITIMVLELKVPHGTSVADLTAMLPVFLGYVLSFVYVGIYWNNHHHMLAAVNSITGPILWANMHLLFWLSVVPFATAWMGENHLAALPVATYGVVLIMNATAYTILMIMLVRHEGPDSALAKAMGHDWKGRLSWLAYAVAIGLAFVQPLASKLIYLVVAMVWFVPDPRVERTLKEP